MNDADDVIAGTKCSVPWKIQMNLISSWFWISTIFGYHNVVGWL